MGNEHGPNAVGGVSVVLLDSAQGKPVHTWRFTSQAEIAIGREEGNDVVISDPHVSRLHARIVAGDGKWMLVSLGRHGTFVDDRLIAEKVLDAETVFRLGPTGPMLRFYLGKPPTAISQTMDEIDTDLLTHLNLDEERMQQEVDQITGGSLFEELLNESQRLKSSRPDRDGTG